MLWWIKQFLPIIGGRNTFVSKRAGASPGCKSLESISSERILLLLLWVRHCALNPLRNGIDSGHFLSFCLRRTSTRWVDFFCCCNFGFSSDLQHPLRTSVQIMKNVISKWYSQKFSNSLCGLLRYIFIAFEKIIWSRIVMYKYRLHSALLCVFFLLCTISESFVVSGGVFLIMSHDNDH
jgi:hypothetical protein